MSETISTASKDGIETRTCKLALLVEQIALGDEDERVASPERFERLAGKGQGLDRMGQHVATGFENAADHGAGHLALGYLDGGFDHRQHEALDAVAVAGNVAALGRQQAFEQVPGIGIIGQQLGEARFGQLEEALVVPERVVGIKADGGKFGGHDTSDCSATGRGCRARLWAGPGAGSYRGSCPIRKALPRQSRHRPDRALSGSISCAASRSLG